MQVRVKICGIRSIESAGAAVQAGADFLGFNFVPTSKRHITPVAAKEIIDRVRGKIKIVGVFQNADSSYIDDVVDSLDLDFVQLHGNEDQAFINEMKTNVIKTITSTQNIQNYDVNYFLLDREIQGKGDLVNEETASKIAQQFPVFLAGGLDPVNVSKIILAVRPFAVDVAGGIETDGKEDVEKIKSFIKNAKGVGI